MPKRKTHEEFLLEVYELEKESYCVLGEYINNTSKIEIRHEHCGNVYKVTPRDFLSGRRCPSCRYKKAAKNITKSHEYFLEKFKEYSNGEYELLSKYKSARDTITVKHLECGRVYTVTASKFTSGRKCKVCAFKKMGKERSKSNEVFLSQIKEVHSDEITVLSEYINQNTKVRVIHNDCKSIWEVAPDSLLRGTSCPHCKNSRGERDVRSYLKDNGFYFEEQAKFDGCFNKQKLPFDFKVYMGGGFFLIEFQGRQHYEPVSVFGGKESFESQIARDEIKREFCAVNNIPLIEIPYYENVFNFLERNIPLQANHEPSAPETV